MVELKLVFMNGMKGYNFLYGWGREITNSVLSLFQLKSCFRQMCLSIILLFLPLVFEIGARYIAFEKLTVDDSCMWTKIAVRWALPYSH